MNFKD